MVSNKVKKYMKQYQERNYAPKTRKIEKSDLSKHSHGSAFRQTNEASSGDSLQQSGQEQEEIGWIIRSPMPDALEKILEEEIEWFGKVVLVTDPVIFTGEENEKAGIQCEARRCIGSQERQEEPDAERSKKRVRRDGKSNGKEKVQRRQKNVKVD